MPKTYTVVLSDIEQKAMEYIALDVDDWIQNAAHNRARVALDELVSDTINARLAAGESVSGSKEEIAMNSNLPNAQKRNEISMKSTPYNV